MAISIITHDDRKIVFGATWVPLVGDQTEKVEVRAIAKKYNVVRGVRVANEYSTLYGVLPKEDLNAEQIKALKQGKSYSASALLTRTQHIARDAIWIEVEDQIARMAAMMDTLPVVGGEFVGPLNDAVRLIEQIQADNPEKMFTVYGNYEDVFPGSIPLALGDLTDEKQDADSSFIVLSQTDPKKMLLLLVLVLGYAAYHFGPQFFRHKPIRPPSVQEDPNATYWRLVPQKLSASALPVSAVRDLIVGDWNSDVLQGGWVEASQECTVASCTYMWSIYGGDNASFRAAMGNRRYTYAPDGTTITYTTTNRSPGKSRMDARNLPTYETFALTGGSLMQQLYLLRAHPSIGVPTLYGEDVKPDLNTAALKDVVRSGALSITGRAALLKATLTKLPDNVSIDSLKIVIGPAKKPDPTFTLLAKYYVKN